MDVYNNNIVKSIFYTVSINHNLNTYNNNKIYRLGYKNIPKYVIYVF